jgi:hypothetical protein
MRTKPLTVLLLTAVATVIYIVACSGHSVAYRIQAAAWFTGSWQHNDGKGITFEHWQRTSDTSLSGTGGYIVGGDTVFREQLELKQMGSELYYIPVIEVQNNGQPVYFKLTKATPDKLVFEAPAHDWPQKIAYTRVTADSIFAEVSGMQQGKMRLEVFPFSRVK